MSLVVFKLMNGDDVIANVVEEDDYVIKITEPRVVINGAQGLAIVPWSPFTEDSEQIELTKSDLLCIMRAPKTPVIDAYNQSTSSVTVVQNKLVY